MNRIIENFAGRALQVAAKKHARHAFNVDHEGRDSFRYKTPLAAMRGIEIRPAMA